MILEYANAVIRVMLALAAIVMVARWRERFVLGERMGLSLVGGSGLLTANVVLERQMSPYDQWAPLLFIIGVTLVFWSSMSRIYRHEAANKAAIRGAIAHFKARGER